jgi:hypothetical protein
MPLMGEAPIRVPRRPPMVNWQASPATLSFSGSVTEF